MKRGSLFSLWILFWVVWGCPKRPNAPVVVYVPAAPSAGASTTTSEVNAIIIEEPAPPEATKVEEAASELPAPAPARRRPRTSRAEPAEATEAVSESPETPPAEVPALEPRESAARQAALRQDILTLQENVRRRAAQVDRQSLAEPARKTLDDAQTFLAQSGQALEEGDLQRAANLANKASLLLSALEAAR